MTRRRRPLPRPTPALWRSLIAFCTTTILALVASVALLWPDAATRTADGLAQAPRHLEQWLPAGLFD